MKAFFTELTKVIGKVLAAVYRELILLVKKGFKKKWKFLFRGWFLKDKSNNLYNLSKEKNPYFYTESVLNRATKAFLLFVFVFLKIFEACFETVPSAINR